MWAFENVYVSREITSYKGDIEDAKHFNDTNGTRLFGFATRE